MLTFLGLCLLARCCYSLNDILIGRAARAYGRTEVAAFRGVSLGVTMAPWLLFVPGSAWAQLAAHPALVLATVTATAAGNLLQFEAARHLPFGLRAALMISTMAICSTVLGWTVLGERLSPLELGLCALLLGSAAAATLGTYAPQEIHLDLPRGALATVLSAAVMAGAVLGVKTLAGHSHPLLAAWTWEFGAGAILLAPVLLRRQGSSGAARLSRLLRIGAAALPTALASGASVLALGYGELGLWAALGGTQILITAGLGAAWHREALGLRRWLCMAVSGAAVAGLAFAQG